MTKRSNDRFRCRDNCLPNADKNPEHRFARLGSVVGGRTDPGATRVSDLLVAQHRVDQSVRCPGTRIFSRRRTRSATGSSKDERGDRRHRIGEAHALGSIGSAIRAIPRGAFTTNGILTDGEIDEHLKADAQILGLPAPVPPARVFDFLGQREVNQELGVK